MSNIIHVGLYGGKGLLGGKETPLEADVIRCDHTANCSFFSDGSCLKIRSFSGGGCRFGKLERHHGYTSRAKKYHEFKSQWQNHEQYNKLTFPKKKFGLIEDQVVFLYPYIRIVLKENGEYALEDPFLGTDSYVIPYKDFTPDLIYRIVTFRPRALMGGVIDSYQKEVVPLFLAHLKEVLPERYKEFVEKYPQFNVKISYIGRKAKLKTLKPSVVSYKSDRYPEFNEDWYWDGEFLTYQKGYIKKPSIVKDFEVVVFKIRPSDDTVVTVTDDGQVEPNTVFID